MIQSWRCLVFVFMWKILNIAINCMLQLYVELIAGSLCTNRGPKGAQRRHGRYPVVFRIVGALWALCERLMRVSSALRERFVIASWAPRERRVSAVWAHRERFVSVAWALCERRVSPVWSTSGDIVNASWAIRERQKTERYFNQMLRQSVSINCTPKTMHIYGFQLIFFWKAQYFN